MAAPAGDAAESLELAGAEVLEIPLPVTPAARVSMCALPLTGCLFRTAEEVDALDEERDSSGFGPEVTALCAGKDVVERARKAGWTRVQELPEDRLIDRLLQLLSGQ